MHQDLDASVSKAYLPVLRRYRSWDPKLQLKVHVDKPKQDIDYTWTLQNLRKRWAMAENRARYDAVAAATNVPAQLVAAIHQRESSGNWKTYLHQGDPLGKKAVRVPKNIPLFYDWTPAAIHAIKMKEGVRTGLGITRGTTDLDLLCAFAEYYNGTGYFLRNRPSAYVLAGTDTYKGGKYVDDGVFSNVHYDSQVGVLPMLWALGMDPKGRAAALK